MFWDNFLQTFGILEITIPQISMILLSFLLAYLAIIKKYEPLLLLPISFGMMIANIPMTNLSAFGNGVIAHLYQGIKLEIYPPLIFL